MKTLQLGLGFTLGDITKRTKEGPTHLSQDYLHLSGPGQHQRIQMATATGDDDERVKLVATML